MRRWHRRKPSVAKHLDRWLISYADYMTLIFALFVVLYSAALVNKEQYRALIDGVSQAFVLTNVPSTSRLEYRDGSLLVGQDGRTLLAPFTSQSKTSAASLIALEQGMQSQRDDDLQDGAVLAKLEEQLQSALAPLLQADVAHLKRDPHWLTLELNASLLFSSGSAFLGSNGAPLVSTLATYLKPLDNQIRVRGYTDNQAIDNEMYGSNWVLSGARAQALLAALISHGVSPWQLAFEGYGEFSPFADNNSEQGRRHNRKVVIAISKNRMNARLTFNKAQTEPAMKEEQNKASPPLVDAQQMQIIALPGGGIRITTRRSE